jgi:hypothetical protein
MHWIVEGSRRSTVGALHVDNNWTRTFQPLRWANLVCLTCGSDANNKSSFERLVAMATKKKRTTSMQSARLSNWKTVACLMSWSSEHWTTNGGPSSSARHETATICCRLISQSWCVARDLNFQLGLLQLLSTKPAGFRFGNIRNFCPAHNSAASKL